MGGRTVSKHVRMYADGYDLSAYVKQMGTMLQEFNADPEAALTDEVKNTLAGQVTLGIGTVNGFLDTTVTSGLHTVLGTPGAKRTIMIPVGIQAAPAAGDPAYLGEFEQLEYKAVPAAGGILAVSIPFGNADAVAAALVYQKPWGVLVHPKGAETAVNTSTGIDDNAAASARGGYMCYQIFSSDGTVTVKMQDAASNLNASFADLTGATSGSVDASVTPKSGIIALANTATVRRYLRWQIVLGTASTVTFALAFCRA